MATQYSNKPIVTDGLVYALDFGNPKSYVSGSTTGNNLKYSPTPSQFLRAGNPGGVDVVNNLGQFTINGTTGSYVTLNMPSNPIAYGGVFTLMYIGKPNSGDSGYFYGAFDGGWPLFRFSSQEFDASGYYTGRTYAGDDSLKFVTVLHSSGSYEYFVNGMPYAPTGFSGGNASPSNPPHLSGRNASQFPFTGSLGCFLVYNRKLTADEIWQNYQILAPKYGLSVPSKPYTLDPNAYLFLSQSGITDPIITSSIDTFVKGLKSANIWDKMVGIYPFVGTGSAGINLTGSHRWNLKEPSTATYGLTFTGTWIGSVSGSAPSGSNTNITIGQVTPKRQTGNAASSLIDQNNVHMSFLSYDTPVSTSYVMGTGMTEELAASTLAGDYGTPAAAYSVRKVRSLYTGSLMDVRRSYDNTTSSIGYNASGDLDTNVLLDWTIPGRSTLPGAYEGLAAAYSLRRVSSSYTGPAIDVRRSYDNTTGSIGFDSNGNLNTASLFTFVSRGDNLVQYSEELDNGYWGKYGVTVTPNTIIAPDGTLTADTLVFADASRELYLDITTNGLHTFSMFVSGTVGQTIWIGKRFNTSPQQETGSLWTLTGGWQRITGSFDLAGGFVTLSTYQSATARTVYAWGAQLNSGSVALPYVKTVASTKTNESGSFDTVSTGWVAQWYDQSGNNRHATQTATGSQPLIVSSGSLVTENGKPAVQFDLNSFIPTPIPINTAMPLDVFATVKVDTVGSTGTWYVGFTGTDLSKYMITQRSVANGGIQSNLVTGSNVGVGGVATNTTNTSSMYLHTTLYNVPTMSMYINNQLIGTSSVVDGNYYNSNQTITIGSGRDAFRGNFKYGELLLYTSSVSSSRPLIENNINNYYSIYTGSNHGFVARWYDQSGNARHATQTTQANQPAVVISSSLLTTPNNKVAITFDGINDDMSTPSLTLSQPTWTFSTLYNTNTTSRQRLYVGSGFNLDINASTYTIWGGSSGITGTRTLGYGLVSALYNGASSQLYENSLLTAAGTAQTGPSNGSITIGSFFGSGDFLTGSLQEIVIHNSNQALNREAIEYGINSYYNIYPQTSSFATSSFAIRVTSGSVSASLNNRLTSGISATGPLGLITVSRTGSNSLTITKNVSTASFAVASSGALATGIYLGAINNNSIALGNSPLNISFASVGTGLTNSETITLSNLVRQLQVNLQRFPSTYTVSEYPGAIAAFSLRKLLTNYTGSAIDVRRSLDNTTASIGFNSYGHLDTSALTSFAGSGNAFVTTWYDQSGNNNHISQSNAALQPLIVTSGSVVTPRTFQTRESENPNGPNNNTYPAIYFNGTTKFYMGRPLYSTNQISYYVVFNLALRPASTGDDGYGVFRTNTSNIISAWGWNTGGGGPNGYINVFQPDNSGRRGGFPPNMPKGGTILYSGYHTGSAYTVYVNNALKGTDTQQSYNSGSFFEVGVNETFTNRLSIQEMIFYATASTANNTNIQNSINAYYQVY